MARHALFAAGVLSLVLVGPMERAHADTEVPNSQRVVQVFGSTLCVGDVAADVACDWRIPARSSRSRPLAQSHPPVDGFTLFGLRFCRAGHEAIHCDVRLPAAPSPGVAARAEAPRRATALQTHAALQTSERRPPDQRAPSPAPSPPRRR